MQVANDYVRISFRQEDFRVSFTPPFAVVFSAALVLSELMFLLADTSSPHVLLFVVPAIVAVLCAVAVALLCAWFKFEIGPEGIECYDVWCRPHRTTWEAVTGVRQVSVLGLDYLLLEVRGSRRTIWIPLFVDRVELLKDLLITYSDDSHQLVRKLERIAA